MKLSTFIFLALTLTHTAAAQQYFRKWVDFGDSVNRAFVHDVEPLGPILLKGYLRGELKAYKFDIRSEDLKWKPLPVEEIPAEWDPRLDYYMEDRVSYKGKYYVTWFDIASIGKPPADNQEWTELELRGDVVSTIHSFPTPADTLAKADLLRNIVVYAEEYLGDDWDETMDYYSTGDIVAYKGQFYECLIDHKANTRRPDKDVDFWMPRKPVVSFYSPRDLSIAGVLYWKSRLSDVTMTPQMLSLYFGDVETWAWNNSGLNFWYSDVVDYLARQTQLPLLYQAELGYIGAPQLLLGYENFPAVLKLIQDNLTGAMKPSKKDIVDATKFSAFIQAKAEDLTSGLWLVVQDMVTNDLVVTKQENAANGVYNAAVVKVPWKAVAKMMIASQPPRSWTHLLAIEGEDFHSLLDTLYSVDSLEARIQPHAVSRFDKMYFIDDRFAAAKDNAVIQESLATLWTYLRKAVETKQVRLQSKETRLFFCDQPFPEVTFRTDVADWNVDEGFKLESLPDIVFDSATLAYPPAGISIHYKRQVTPQKSKEPLFEPLKLAVSIFHPDAGLYYNYYFLWADVEKIAASNEILQPLLAAIKSGRLKFDSSAVVYGLVGEK